MTNFLSDRYYISYCLLASQSNNTMLQDRITATYGHNDNLTTEHWDSILLLICNYGKYVYMLLINKLPELSHMSIKCIDSSSKLIVSYRLNYHVAYWIWNNKFVINLIMTSSYTAFLGISVILKHSMFAVFPMWGFTICHNTLNSFGLCTFVRTKQFEVVT